MQRYVTLIRLRPQFRYLWLAAVVSFAGDWFNTIASVILVNRYLDSNTAVGLLFVARALPPFFLGPIAGVIADRFNRKTVLIATDLLRAGIVLSFLFIDRPERAWLIYALTIAQFVISAFFEPARAAILPSLVEGHDELLIANTLSGITWSAMLALGAALGGVVTGLFGVATAIIIDAISFLLSAFFIWRIQSLPHSEPIEESEAGNGLQDLIEGFRYVSQHPRTGLIASVKAFTQIGSPDIMIAIYAAQIFPYGKDGALALGLLYAAAGLGAILGPLLANALTDGSTRLLQNAIGISFAVVAAGWLLFGWAPTLPLALFAMLLRHMGGSTNWTYSNVLLQMRVPDRFLGRVFALDFALFTLAMSLSVWLSGILLDQTNLDPRHLSFLLALGSLLPLLPWMWLNQSDPQRHATTVEDTAV
ncbi:MAG: MFS transporter [Ardenticatenaceae bacterium]|nr:MFS transporter [Ardenticatenaceae bacterium]